MQVLEKAVGSWTQSQRELQLPFGVRKHFIILVICAASARQVFACKVSMLDALIKLASTCNKTRPSPPPAGTYHARFQSDVTDSNSVAGQARAATSTGQGG
jgi:hypothetical protein